MASNLDSSLIKEWLIENSPNEIIWMNEEGNILYANTKFCDRLGYKKSEIVKLSIFDINPFSSSEIWKNHWKTVQEKKLHQFKAVHQNKKGKLYEVEVSAQFFSNNGKNLICAIVNDITNSSFYKDLMINTETIANIGGWILDLQDNSLIVTNGVLKIFKTENKEDLMLSKIIHYFSDPEILKKHISGAMQKGKSFDLTLQTNENPQRFIRIAGNPFLKKDKVIKIFIVFQDVTQQETRGIKLNEALEEIKSLKERLESENEYLQEEISNKINAGNIICKSEAYKKVIKQINLVAPTDSTVLITGESGTGKELIASTIHSNSLRKNRTLIKVNCATLPKELIESELFGHKKGAFTGAVSDKIGKFTLADGGTIFLDEIGEMPIDLQAKLLRVLQEGEFDELGGNKTTKVNVRVIAATNRHLEKMIKEGTFREDLYYRLNVFPIYNIPLRERKEDIPLLAQFFLEKYSTKAGKGFKRLSKKTIEALMNYNFPGNIRELENLIERAVIIENGTTLNPGNWIPIPSNIIENKDLLTLEEFQRQHIINVLKQTKGRVSGVNGAAKILDVKDKTLFAKMKKLGIEKETIFRKINEN